MSKSKVTAEERAEVAKACAEGRISQIAAAKKIEWIPLDCLLSLFCPFELNEILRSSNWKDKCAIYEIVRKSHF